MNAKTSHPATSLLRNHGRAIAHMRDRHSIRRFGLVLGAGVSRGLGFPTWRELLDRIAAHPSVDGSHLTAKDEHATYRSQILFQHFRARRLETEPGSHASIAVTYDIEVEWKKIIHNCLYESVDTSKPIDNFHYLHKFLPLIQDSPLTVNYNFDDSVQRMLLKRAPKAATRSVRGYTTVWSANIQVEAEEGVIYHPNGFLPLRLADQPSEDLVFLEESFADQLIASTSGHYAILANHLMQTTCLLIGLSLDDPTLRFLLRQSARSYPGHCHYYVSYCGTSDKRDEERKRAEFDSNLAVHNLVTLFLDHNELAALGELLTMSDEAYRTRLEELKLPKTYRFFLAGPVGVGKTTALSKFRSLRTHEEWPDPLLETMIVDPKTLGPSELKAIDDWVNDQLERKNSRLMTIGVGVDIIDRAPLDAFAFVPRGAWAARAVEIRAAIESRYPGRRLAEGHLILLVGDPSIIEPRAHRVLRKPTTDGLKRQETVLREIYAPPEAGGVTIIDTRDRSPAEVAWLIGQVIHGEPYAPFDFHERLDDICDGKYASLVS